MASTIRQVIVGSLGPKSTHAVEDGLTIGIIAGFLITYTPFGLLLAAILSGAPVTKGPMAVLADLPELVREEDARLQESFLTGGATIGLVVGLGVGKLAASVAGPSMTGVVPL